MAEKLFDMLNRLKIYAQHIWSNKWLVGSALVSLAVGLLIVFCITPKDKALVAVEQLQIVSNNIRKQYAAKPDYWGLETAAAIEDNLYYPFVKQDNNLFNAAQNSVTIGSEEGQMLMPGSKTFNIVFHAVNHPACKQMISLKEYPLALQSITLISEIARFRFAWGEENPLPISEHKAGLFCQESNEIIWEFN